MKNSIVNEQINVFQKAISRKNPSIIVHNTKKEINIPLHIQSKDCSSRSNCCHLKRIKQKFAYYQLKLQTKLSKLYHRIPVFNPYNKVLLSWEVIQITAILVLLFAFPLVPFVQVKLENIIIKISSILISVDMLVRINTGFFLRDSFIKNHKQIFKRYIKSDLVYDTMGFLSILSYYSSHKELEMFTLLILLKNIIYVKSIFFALVTMVTIGYGDIVPVSYEETIFCSLVMILACGMFGYSLNQIGRIFEIFFKDSDNLKENIAIMNTYMQKKSISQSLQFQIRQYLQYYWNENKAIQKKQQTNLINSLSRQLQQQLLMDANKLVLKEVKILSNHFSEELMKQTANLIKEFNSTPDEVIFQEGETSSQNSLYFIEKGRCEVYLEKNEKVQSIKILNKGDYFGSFGFFTGNQRLCNVKSKDFCTLLYINRQEFLDLCKQHLEDYEKFCFIKDKLQFENDFSLIDENCYQCKQKTHIFQKCPQKHFNNKTDYISYLIKEQQVTQIERVFKDRIAHKYVCPLNNLQDIVQNVSKYQQIRSREISKYRNDNYLIVMQNLYDSDDSINEKDEDDDNNINDLMQQSLLHEDNSIKKVIPLELQSQLDDQSDSLNLYQQDNQAHIKEKQKTNSISKNSKPQRSSKTQEITNDLNNNNDNNNTKNERIKPRYSKTEEIYLQHIDLKHVNEYQIQSNKRSIQYEKQTIKNKINQIEQISETEQSQKIVQSPLDNGIQKYIKRQTLIPPPPADEYDHQDQLGGLKKNRLKNINERMNKIKMVERLKKIICVSAMIRHKNKKGKENVDQLISQPYQLQSNNQLAFYLLKQKNIKEQSYSYELLQKEFEHFNKYKMYYPLGNYDVVINSYNIQNFEKNKPQNDQKKKLMNKIERQFMQQPHQIQDSHQITSNTQDMLTLFSHYRDMKLSLKKSSYPTPTECQQLSTSNKNTTHFDQTGCIISKNEILADSIYLQDLNHISKNQSLIDNYNIDLIKEQDEDFQCINEEESGENIKIGYPQSEHYINQLNNPLIFDHSKYFQK